jgi:hypothetical protein
LKKETHHRQIVKEIESRQTMGWVWGGGVWSYHSITINHRLKIKYEKKFKNHDHESIRFKPKIQNDTIVHGLVK